MTPDTPSDSPFDLELAEALLPILGDLYAHGETDGIAAARIAKAVRDAGYRRITHEVVEAAMERVPNLGVEAYEPTVSQLTAALLQEEIEPSDG